MKVGVYYFHLLALGGGTSRVRTVEEFHENALRFAATYRQFPPKSDHELVVVFLRGTITDRDRAVWDGIPCRFEHYQPRETDGWSMQAWQEQSAKAEFDFMVALCSRAHFHRPGWLHRMVEARHRHGDGIYGSMASFQGCPLGGGPAHNPHLRGTMYGCDSKTFNLYPHKITSAIEEYYFECGQWNVCSWYASLGKPVMMVTFDGEWAPDDWGKPVNTFCNGDQSNLLNWDRHTEAYRTKTPLIP